MISKDPLRGRKAGVGGRQVGDMLFRRATWVRGSRSRPKKVSIKVKDLLQGSDPGRIKTNCQVSG